MTDPHAHEPEPTDEEAAELVAFLDGRLPAEQHAAVAARVAADPVLAAALERRRHAADVIAAAVADTEAPHDLRLRIDALSFATPRAAARPRRRWLPFGAVAGALAAAAVAVVIAVGGAELTVPETVQAALRPPVAAIGVDLRQPALLRQHVDRVQFPNFARRFGWTPTGTRTDEIDGRRTRTVFYEKGGQRIAYTIVAGDALEEPEDAVPAVRDGIKLRSLRAEGRVVVTWQRSGRTCVLSGTNVSAATLLELAAWRAQGAVKF